jgi:hypothetical protein
MSNGQRLTLDHWVWLFRHQPEEASIDNDQRLRREIRLFRHRPKETPADEKSQWLHRELAWIRKEPPSAAVLVHVEEILEAEHQREVDRVRECMRDAIGALEMI